MIENPVSPLKYKYGVVVYGQRDYYQIQLALYEVGALACIFTDIYFPNWLIHLVKHVSPGLAGYLSHRNHPGIPVRYFINDLKLPFIKRYLKHRGYTLHESYSYMDYRHSRRAAAYAVRNPDIAILCYSYYWKGVAEAKAAGYLKNPTFVFQVHPVSTQIKRIIEADRQKTGLNYSPEPEEETTTQEDLSYLASLRYADGIICSSSFAARGLMDEGVPSEKIRVVPYGIEFSSQPPLPPPDQVRWRNQEPLKVLWVGQLAYRKGVHYIFDAIRQFSEDQVQVSLVSHSDMPGELSSSLPSNVHIFSSVNNTSLLEMYRTHHLLILPSLVEGFGLVLVEALKEGLPILCTHNTGGPDIITTGVEGFIVPPGNSEAIGEILKACLLNPNTLPEMSKAAIQAGERQTWPIFRKNIRRSLLEFEQFHNLM